MCSSSCTEQRDAPLCGERGSDREAPAEARLHTRVTAHGAHMASSADQPAWRRETACSFLVMLKYFHKTMERLLDLETYGNVTTLMTEKI